MSTLKVKTSVDNGKLQFKLDGKVIMRDTGSASVELPDGSSHTVEWIVIGVQGTNYSIVIDSPESAKMNLTKTLGPEGKDYGGFSFTA